MKSFIEGGVGTPSFLPDDEWHPVVDLGYGPVLPSEGIPFDIRINSKPYNLLNSNGNVTLQDDDIEGTFTAESVRVLGHQVTSEGILTIDDGADEEATLFGVPLALRIKRSGSAARRV